MNSPDQPTLIGYEAKRRSRIKTLKKRIHRADQRGAVDIYEITCPTCGAQGHDVRQDGMHRNGCDPPGGGYLPPYYYHLSRRQAQQAKFNAIQEAADAARLELETLNA